MPDERRNPADDPLIRYWDQLVRGDAEPPIDLDPTLVETIHRFRGLDDAPAPDSAFLTRLQEDLMPTATLSASLGSGALSTHDGRAAPHAHATWSPALPAVARRHWTVSQLATAALLLSLIHI